MAPNLKHFSQLTAPLAGPKVVRVKQAASYQPQPAAPAAVDSASYWEWPTEVEPAQLVSTEHIQVNLIKAAAEQQQGKSVLDASKDDYWAEEVAQDEPEHDEEPATAVSQQEQEAVDPNNYWAESSHKYNNSDDYWNTSAKVVEEIAAAGPAATTTVRNPSVNPSESAAYWQEEIHNCQSTTNDAYWRESRPVESADGDYWTWDVQTTCTVQSDVYWTWNCMASSPSKLAALVSAY